MALTAVLSGCGGSGGTPEESKPPITTTPGVDITNVTPEQVKVAQVMQHSAALGVLVGSTVEVRNAFDKSGTVLYTTTTDNNGQYAVVLPDYAKYSVFLVTVTGGNDWDVNDTGTRDATPTPFNGSLNALVDANDLLNGSIRVNMLSDAAYRLIGGDFSRFDASSLNIELNRMAATLLKKSVKGADSVTSGDLLQFDATDIAHRAALAFDFASLSRPLTEGADTQTMLQKYHAGGTDLTQGWRILTGALSGVTPTLTEMENKNTVKLQAGVAGLGRMTGTALPDGVLNEGPNPYSTVLPRDGSTVSFQAVEIDPKWQFNSWTGCAVVIGSRCDVVMSQDIAVTARFSLKEPVVAAAVTSLGRLVPQDSVTGVRFNADGTATIVTRDTATIAFLQTVTAGSFVQTGHVEHPTVKVTEVVSPATSVTASAPDASTAPMVTMTFRWTEASPIDVYETASIVVDSTPVGFDEVRAITLGDDVGGSVRTVLPVPDFTSSVVAGSVMGTPPSWYVTASADGTSCHGFGSDAIARAALQTAWQASPRTYPFNATALANCVGIGQFSIAGDLTDYVMAKSMGEADQFSGRHDGTGKLAMRLPKAGAVRGDSLNPILAKGQSIERRGEPVWVAGIGLAIPLGNNLFFAARESESSGFRLVALQNSATITSGQAINQARSDCALKGLHSACGLLAGIERERQGLRNVGMIPLLSAPLSLTLSKPNSNLSGKVSLNLNIDLSPNASVSWSLGSLWVRASAGANYTVKPELGLTVAYGKTVENFTVPTTSKKKKFNKNNSKSKTDANKIENKKTLIKVDLGRMIPYAGAVLDLSLNLDVGVDLGGEMSVTVTPTLTMAGDFGMRAYYEWRCCRSNDREISAWFNMPTRQPGISAELKGTLSVEPYAEVNIAAGLRGVAPEVAKLYVRGGLLLRGEVSTGFSYATKFRDFQKPDTFSEGQVKSNSSKYWENCNLDTRVTNPSSCGCSADQTHRESHWYGGSYTVVDRKCVQRGAPVRIAGAIQKIPQRCVNSPELALGAYIHGKAGAATSSDKFAWPLNGWLNFMNRDFAFFDQEWPIWEYPAKDDQPESELAGCKDVT